MKMFLFLVVAVVSVVYAASLVEDKPLKEAADSNRVFEFLYTANTSRTLHNRVVLYK